MTDTDALTDIRIAIEEPRSWARRLTITVPAERIERERREVAKKLARRIRLPGFRQGKVPPGVVERRFGAAIEHETVERVVGEAYREALEQHQFQPITQGEVEDVNYRAGADLTFRVEFEVRPEIELGRIGGFRLERVKPSVAPAETDEVLERLRQEQAQWRPIEDGSPEDGDMVRIELTPTDGTRPAEPRTYQIRLGDPSQAIPSEIDAAVRTLTAGGETEVPLQLESPEGGEQRAHGVRLRLLEARHPELPALDDDFARSVGDFQDLTALRSAVTADLEREANADADRKLRQDLIEQIIEANPFDVPSSMVNGYLDRLFPADKRADPEQIARVREAAAPAAERALKRRLVIERLAEMQGLAATPEEVDARVEALAERQGRSASEVWAQLQKGGYLAGLEDEITEDKVFDYLLSQSTVA